jgi:uncharacterized protein
LLLDIENRPNKVLEWDLWKPGYSLDKLQEPNGLLCFAAKWLGDPRRETVFWSEQDGHRTMVQAAHVLLDEADVIVHYYGKRHDIPWLNTEFLQEGLKPPAPYRQIDLCEVVKRQFSFPSNRLDYVSKALGLGGKASTGGFGTWIGCMEDDPGAWKRMERYNRQDVWLLEGLYKRLQPWIPGHPSHAVFQGGNMCPRCGSERLQKRGYAFTLQSSFQRYQCQACGGWSRSTKRTDGVTIREVANA